MRVEQTEDYRRWITGLRDPMARARILVRVDRLIHGNAGAHRNLTDGVSELKIDVGPGYRVYYTQRGNAATCCCCCWSAATSPPRPKTLPKTLPKPSPWQTATRNDHHAQDQFR